MRIQLAKMASFPLFEVIQLFVQTHISWEARSASILDVQETATHARDGHLCRLCHLSCKAKWESARSQDKPYLIAIP